MFLEVYEFRGLIWYLLEWVGGVEIKKMIKKGVYFFFNIGRGK